MDLRRRLRIIPLTLYHLSNAILRRAVPL